MFSLTLINQPDTYTLSVDTLTYILPHLERIVPKAQRGNINIAYISDADMQALNFQYRQKESSTDVLSFHYADDFSTLSDEDTAGEIVLSESYILRQSAEHGHTPLRETTILVIHGLLHILGYDHETDEDYALMWKYEEQLRGVILDLG